MLDSIDDACDRDERLTIAAIQEIAGRRASAPLILLPGLAILSPLSGIPTVPTFLGLVIGLVSLQIMLGRSTIWLPKRLGTSGISAGRAKRAVGWVRPVAGVIDRFSSRRLEWFANPVSVRLAGLMCLLIAVCMPAMELVPFSSSIAGMFVAVLGLALMTHDGLLFAFAYLLFAGAVAAAALLVA
nr:MULTISPECIES: exopolysaccharide biosynthesis protein [unclassified Ciceribacter]